MPSSDHLAIWLALLASCGKWGNVKLGRLAFNQAVQLDSNCATAYALMAGIFVDANMQKDAEKAEAMRSILFGRREDLIFGYAGSE
jgi:Flp pilus assembly protein TadD